MAPSVAAFRPNDSLTQAELQDLVAGLTEEPPKQAANPGAPVTMAQLDARLVRALGLGAEATAFYRSSRSGRPASARALRHRGRRTPARPAHQSPHGPGRSRDGFRRIRRRALRPPTPPPQILRMSDWETKNVEEAAATFEIPTLTAWQRRVLTTAVSFIGFPYVWGGESEWPASPFGLQARGGFDCSGFAWRVYKLQSYRGAPQLAGTLRGRTAAAMAGEVPRQRRIKLGRLAPADLLFFGDGGRRANAARIDHMAIYLGNGWLIQSSRNGVALAPVAGWYDDRLAWGRRPLSEAGL